MAIDADLSSTMTERFGVSGALLVKLFGRPATDRGGLGPGGQGADSAWSMPS